MKSVDFADNPNTLNKQDEWWLKPSRRILSALPDEQTCACMRAAQTRFVTMRLAATWKMVEDTYRLRNLAQWRTLKLSSSPINFSLVSKA
jgi:hypothetical protein